jgi:hypothetical protein
MTLSVVPFFISAQPANLATYVGGPATFNVGLTGTGPYSYQWQFYGTNLPAATNNPLVLTNAHFSDSGPYSVIVTNAFGTIQSADATLTVVPILITLQPTSQVGFLGETIGFTVSAQANPPPTYQWQYNGVEISGATADTLVLTNCQYNQSGIYSVLLTSSATTTNSVDGTLSVVPVAAWGSDKYAQINVPAGLSNVIAVAGGALHSLALRTDGTVVRWGSGPDVPPDLTNAVAISAGGSHDLALRADGAVIAWGLNDLPSDLTNALAVAAGDAHSLALKPNQTVAVWGGNSNGQTNVPPDLTNVIAVAAGSYHSLALRRDGTVVSWGDNGSGQTNVPMGLTNVVAIAGGSVHSLALKADGHVVVWGSAGYGIPDVPASATNVVAIGAGYGHCMVLKADGSVLAWGYSYDGETAVPGDLNNVVGIGAGNFHSLAVVADGTDIPQVRLTGPALNSVGFSVSLDSRSGKVYQLEYKNSLTDSNWAALPLVAGTGGSLTLTDPSATAAQRFYRVRRW